MVPVFGWASWLVKEIVASGLSSKQTRLRELVKEGGGALHRRRSYGMDLLRWFRFLWALGVVGIRRHGLRHAILSGGCRSRPSPRGRIGAIRLVVPRDRAETRRWPE
ncbi:hypothetical protein GCM10023063_21160 [Arthrobacter methylotrophus]